MKMKFEEWVQQHKAHSNGKPKLYAGLKLDHTRCWVWANSIEEASQHLSRNADFFIWIKRDKAREDRILGDNFQQLGQKEKVRSRQTK